ncbi:FAD-dependent oxidoreductase [Pseudonocardia ailaonensis]|uniref:oxidoreductase n=1 Tax=Pseudonocardia ailaonensis TaxID=367279 RepID=UPI0031DDC892
MTAGTEFPRLFTPLRMGRVELRNRLVFAGHGSRFVDPHDHVLTRRQAHYLAERARGGVGLVIQGSGVVHPTGLTFGGINQTWDDACIPAYAMVAEAVQAHGAAIVGQLSHLGRQGSGFPSHRELWAPSAVPDPASRVVPHAMTTADIAELVDSYRSAARRFLTAGFDGLEVYLAHGYLLCSFLSRFSNTRTDAYGGSLENRMRLPLEVLAAVREVAGPDVPVGIRVSGAEFVPGGLEIEESREIVARLLAATPVHYVSVSQSNYATMDRQIPDMSFPRAPFVHLAGAIREVAGGVPVIAVARIVTPGKAEELLADGIADMVALVRPLIADPELPNKAREGRTAEIRPCISCNVGCRGGPHRGVTVACLVNPVVGFEEQWGADAWTTAGETRHVVVVGGGPAGLKAAETAALRGHRVTLLEAGDVLGGQVLTAASAMPYRDEFADSTRHLEREIRRLGVEVRLGTPADADTVVALEPDVVVVATGSRPGLPDVPGADLPHVTTVQAAIEHGVTGARVVVLDCGEADWKSLTTAEKLAADGHAVTVVTPVPAGAEIDSFSRPPLLRRLGAAGVEILEYRSVVAIGTDHVRVRHGWSGAEECVPADAVVCSWYGVARDELVEPLRDKGMAVRVVGDALAPRRAIDAVWDGFRVGVEA